MGKERSCRSPITTEYNINVIYEIIEKMSINNI